MTDDEQPQVDPREAAEAEALRLALEGERDRGGAPDRALEVAALVRAAGGGDRLAPTSRSRIREELLSTLPRREARRQPAARWLATALSGALAIAMLMLWSASDRDATEGEADTLAVAQGESPALAPASREAMPTADRGEAAAWADTLRPESGEPRAGLSTAGTGASKGVRPSGEGRAAPALEPLAEAGTTPMRARLVAGAEPPGALDGTAPPRAARSPAPRARSQVLDGPAAAGAPAPPGASRPAASRPATGAERASSIAGAAARYRRDHLAGLWDESLERAHARLDRARSPGERRAARDELESVSTRSLGTRLGAAEQRVVRLDVYCRLAENALALRQPREALSWVRQGQALAAGDSPLTAQLYSLEGAALAALGEREAAAESYAHALGIYERLLDASLSGEPPARGPDEERR